MAKSPEAYDKSRAKQYAKDAAFTSSPDNKRFDQSREKSLKSDQKFDLSKARGHLDKQ